jgi:hypothetical protein
MTGPITVTFANWSNPVRTLVLESHYTERTANGFACGTTATTLTLTNGLTVQMPHPFLPIGNELGISPTITPDGENAVGINLARWSPIRFSPRGVYGFPFDFGTQAVAVQVCRAFDADPRMTWQHTPDEIGQWLRQHGADFGLRF